MWSGASISDSTTTMCSAQTISRAQTSDILNTNMYNTITCFLHLQLFSRVQMQLMEHGREKLGYRCCLIRPADHVLG